jgi:hypothetical protein
MKACRLTYQIGAYNRNSRIGRPPTHLPNRQLSRCLGWRFSILDLCPHNCLTRRNIHHSMARTQQITKPQWRGVILLAIPTDCLVCQAPLLDLPANIRRTPSILYCVLCWFRVIMGRIWAGIACRKKEECI